MFDKAFNWLDTKKAWGCDFTPSPALPAGFAPFGIHNIGGVLYVTYAKQDAAKHDNVNGPGLGYVHAFNTFGCDLGQIAGGGSLNAPWAVAMAPGNFGGHSNQLLIGNFGDGTINAYTLNTTVGSPPLYAGALLNSSGQKNRH